MTAAATQESVNVVIGGTGIDVVSSDADFLNMLRRQYTAFIDPEAPDSIRLEVDLVEEPRTGKLDDDVEVRREADLWSITRGDFEARYDPVHRNGTVRQSPNRHSVDSVIRIIHSLTLARERGFLLHAASAIRNGRAYVFAGRSGAGKTTIARHAPSDACLLSDEVSYVRKSGGEYLAFGTPFTGELGTPGANRSAPVQALCFLRQAAENRMIPLAEPEALRQLLGNVLFFANDPDLVGWIFETAAEFVASVETLRLDFTPGDRVWELIP